MDAALGYLGYRARTVRVVERYLDEKQYGEYEIMQVIDRLAELGLVNDTAFAEEFVASRLRTKPVSRRHLREQLYAHELPREVIDEALSTITDETERANALEVAKKYAEQFASLPREEREQRVTKRVLARGFSYETVKNAMAELSLTASAEDGDAEETEIW